MSATRRGSTAIATLVVVAAVAAGNAAAQVTTSSTTGSMSDSVAVLPITGTVAIDDTSTTGTTSMPSDITISGESDTSSSSEGLTLDGAYVITAGGSRQSAILGSITFDPTGTIVTGTISIVSAATSSASPTVTTSTVTTSTEPATTGGTGSSTGSDVVPVATAADATVTDCTATGGSYSLATGGAGEAQLQLDCSGNERTVTWRLFVTATDGFTQAQQIRAVQIEPLSASGDDGIIDLTLTRQ